MCYFDNLYLSATFDTVDHESLTEELMLIGAEDVALELFKNYLENRSCHDIINGTKSKKKKKKLHRRVPQGSVLGPVLFSISGPDPGFLERGT